MTGAAQRPARAPRRAAVGCRRLAFGAALALAVVLQGALAPVLGLGVLRQAGAADAADRAARTLLAAAICGPEGLRRDADHAQADGAPDPQPGGGRPGEEGCSLACHAVPQPPCPGVPEGSVLPDTDCRPAGLAWVPNPATASPPRPPLRPGAPRAPPPPLS
ncbi:hypothetical protein GCM10010964_11200 [Caldovatus sediminis]|uniref:Uncharacterized protein n=1 Tax=Caldovatus sediminis TaxID=2041189 RepID=A0A8J2Z9V9_9PROT|nr:hypothetical protein [Caldovatus sediminis]GGG24924.1 hypothetical protein GCM10010964_11200 [Caldovatus sediminis]